MNMNRTVLRLYQWTEQHFCFDLAPLPYFRLHGGNTSSEGFLSLLKNGTWHPICDETISDAQINATCQIMGYKHG
jgi:hypothetical protein